MPKVGDKVDIYLERIENALGQAVLSRDKARREEAWVKMHTFFEKEEPVNGEIVGRVKGCLLYTSPSPRDLSTSRMPSSA